MLEVTPIETPQFSLLSYIIRDAASGACIVVNEGPTANATNSDATRHAAPRPKRV